MMRYLYQCRNKGKYVILLTKHESDIYESLVWHSIAKELFDKVITVPVDREKHEFIEPKGAIFIDNYFHDRKRVADILGIPVFDVDAVECLCD